jgi:hypothetical protein
MDDCTITVPVYLANRVAVELDGIFQTAGLVLNVQKCSFVGPRAAEIENPVFECNPLGEVILGSPTGSFAFREEQCQSIVEDMTACLPTLVRMKVDPAIGINLIRYCINPRASYLARVQDVEAIPALHQFDVAVDIAICRVAEHTH